MTQTLDKQEARALENYKQLIDSLGGIVWEADARSFESTFVSKGIERLLGYSIEQWMADPAFWSSRIHPDDRERVFDLSSAAIADKQPYELEYRLTASDGRVVWVRDIVSVVEEGDSVKLRGLMVDITEQKKTEENMRLSEERFRALFEQSPTSSCIHRPDGSSVRANPAILERFGVTVEQAARYNVLHDQRHSEPGVMSAIERALAGEATHIPLTRFDPVNSQALNPGLGGVRWLKGFAYPIKDLSGSAQEIVFSWDDVTDQIEAEKAAKRLERRYELLVNSLDSAVYEWEGDERDGRFTFVSKLAERLLGYSTEQWQTEVNFWSNHLHPDDREWVQRYSSSAIAARRPHEFEYRMVASDGREVWVRDMVSTVSEERGTITISGIMLDITRQKEIESELRRSEEQYRAIFESATDGFAIGSLDGLTVEVNPAFAAMHGYTPEEMVGMDPREYIHPDSYGIFGEFYEKSLAGEHFKNQAVDLRKDGSAFHVEVSGAKLMYKGEPHVLGIIRDVTERVEADKLIRMQEEQYRAIFEASTDGITISDLNGNVVEVNPAFAEMHGYSREEMAGMSPQVFIHPDYHAIVPEFFETLLKGQTDQQELAPEISQLVRGGKRYNQGIAKDVRKDGSIFPVEVHGTLFMYRGEPHILCVVRDTTERMEADKLLRQRDEQYRAVFEASVDGLAIADLNAGTLVEVNPAWADMHGYTREEMAGMHPSVFVHPDDYEIQAAFVEKARAGERPYTQGRDVRKDGTVFRMEVSASPFLYNNQPHVLAIMRDITERMQAEEQLRLKDEQYRSIFEATTDGLVISDLEGNVLEVNPAFAATLGYTREELVGMDPRKWIHPDSHANLEAYLEKVSVGERFVTVGTQVRKNGEAFPAEAHEAPFVYNGQRHTLAIIRDITERVQAQELLERRVEDRTRELATLLEVSSNVASTLELEPLLGRILEQIQRVADYGRASITVDGYIDDDAVAVMAWGKPTSEALPELLPISVEKFGLVGEKMERGEPIVISDVHTDDPSAQAVRQAILEALNTFDGEARQSLETAFRNERSMLLAPLALKDRIIGGLFLRHREPGYYTERHARLVMGIANQAAIAIENARLLSHAHEKAALEERQRLARELHDSVTQALFSINLIARSVEVMLQREGTHSEETMEKMTDLRHLTHGALAEMRALIFELRPGALEEEGLVQAIRKHAAGVQGREMLPIEVIADENKIPRLKPAAEESLYRIAQEALHNIVKHAKATRVELDIRVEGEEDARAIVLRVVDNGLGFDLSAVPAGHMGLGTMSQRAIALGGDCKVESATGEGTVVVVRVPLISNS